MSTNKYPTTAGAFKQQYRDGTQAQLAKRGKLRVADADSASKKTVHKATALNMARQGAARLSEDGKYLEYVNPESRRRPRFDKVFK